MKYIFIFILLVSSSLGNTHPSEQYKGQSQKVNFIKKVIKAFNISITKIDESAVIQDGRILIPKKFDAMQKLEKCHTLLNYAHTRWLDRQENRDLDSLRDFAIEHLNQYLDDKDKIYKPTGKRKTYQRK